MVLFCIKRLGMHLSYFKLKNKAQLKDVFLLKIIV